MAKHEIIYSVSEVVEGKMKSFNRGETYDLEKEGVPAERVKLWCKNKIVKEVK